MAVQPPNLAQKTIVTSDYPIDKVVFRKAGSTPVPKATTMSDSITITIPHGLPFTPLPIGTYSPDNFSTSQDFASGPYFYNPLFAQYGTQYFANIESDATNFYVKLISFDAARTMYYRVIGLSPVSIPPTPIKEVDRAGGLFFNSDDNYLKIYSQNTVSINDSGAFGFDSTVIDHNLGYIPTCLVFTEWGDTIRQIGSENSMGVTGIEAYAYVSPTQLSMFYDPYFAGLLKLHYKVYLDG